jgi:hypothetical protein
MSEGEVILEKVFDLPEGAIYNGGVAVCQYLDNEGGMGFSYKYDTTGLPLSSTLGLLEIAKQHLYDKSFSDKDEDE